MNLGLCLPPGYGGAVGSASGTVTDKRSRGAGRGITLEGTGRGAGGGPPGTAPPLTESTDPKSISHMARALSLSP